MATQEERISTLEKTFATFRKETTARTQEIEENTTIMLGVMRAQGQDIRRIFERVETMDQHIEAINQHIEAIDSRFSKLETKFDEQTALLTEILKRLPEHL